MFNQLHWPLPVTKVLCLLGLIMVSCQVGSPAGLEPAAEPSNSSISLVLTTYATGLNRPVGIVNAGDERLFVVERTGVLRIVLSDGTVIGTPFLDIQDRVDASPGEEGLLGLVFHPDYNANGYFYVNYINTTSGTRRTHISRFSVTADANIADPSSEEILLTVMQPDSDHNAGDIHFGPDGYLYIPLGDGGISGDPDNNAQNTTNLLGAITRIDVDASPGVSPDCNGAGTGNYTIPNDNPYIDGLGGNCDEIWAHGLRNPWRSSFDRLTGDYFIGDVGQGSWEEIDFQPSSSVGGENYGWRCYEGNNTFDTSSCGPISDYDFPIFTYANAGGDCAIIGGYVYRGTVYANLFGRYLLTDYCSGRFWDLFWDGTNWVATQHDNLTGFGSTTFGQANNGELYLARIDGTIYHVQERSAAFDSWLPIIIND